MYAVAPSTVTLSDMYRSIVTPSQTPATNVENYSPVLWEIFVIEERADNS